MRPTAFLLALISLLADRSICVDIAPPSGECWNSTLGVVTAELDGLYDPSLAGMERTYTMCPIEIEIGIMRNTSESLLVEGGDFPIIAFLPNLHIRCEVAGTCILSGGQQHLINLAEPSLLILFLGSRGLVTPDTFTVDSSDLLIEGMTFSKGAAVTEEFAPVSVFFEGPGQNMIMMSCLWKENRSGDSTQLLRSGLALERPKNATVPEGFTFYSSLLILNCNFEDNSFWYAALESSDENGGPDIAPVLKLEVFGGAMTNNSIETAEGAELSAVVSLADVVGLVQGLNVLRNTMVQAASTVTVLDGDVSFASLTFANNTIGLRLTECENISIHVTVGSETELESCVGDASPTAPTAPTAAPPSLSMLPSEFPTDLGSGTSAPVTSNPATSVPTTLAPSATAPITSTPVATPATEGPVTFPPSALPPVTVAPATAVPTTIAPISTSPAVVVPSSSAVPTLTASPSSLVSMAPASAGPSTSTPVSTAPASVAPSLAAPATTQPVTTAPVPTTATPVGSTILPTTTAPSTLAPISPPPSTFAPAASPAPTTFAPSPSPLITTLPTSDGNPSIIPTPSFLPTNVPVIAPTRSPITGPTSSPASLPSITVPTVATPSPGLPTAILMPTSEPIPSEAPIDSMGMMGMGMGMGTGDSMDGMNSGTGMGTETEEGTETGMGGKGGLGTGMGKGMRSAPKGSKLMKSEDDRQVLDNRIPLPKQTTWKGVLVREPVRDSGVRGLRT